MSYGKLGTQGMSAPSEARTFARLRAISVANAVLLAGIIALAIAYLVMNNKSATKGFVIRSIEQQISTLQDEKKKLDLQTLTSESMDSIKTQVSGLGFVPVTKVEFVSGAAGSVAVR